MAACAWAIHAPNLGLSLPDQPFGKDVANRGLYTALATHGGFEQISFRTADNSTPAILQRQFGAAPSSAQLTLVPLTQTLPALRQAHCFVVNPIFLSWPGNAVTFMVIRLTAWWG